MVSPIVGAIASFIIPGLGQALAGDIKKGVIFFVILLVIGFVISYVIKIGILSIIVSLAYRIYAAYDAYQMTQ